MTSELEGLAKAYVELVELSRRGAQAEARVLYQRISHALRSTVETVWAQGQGHVAQGDFYAALLSYEALLRIHQQNLLNLDLPVPRRACFEQIAAVLGAMGQAVAAEVATTLVARDGASFYQPSPSCQIPILGALLEHLFGQRTDGCFVEVGAYDGETFSNTSCLADMGWRGLYIEPVEQSYLRCVERHRGNPGIHVRNCAIGPEATTIRFWDNGHFSTGSTDEMAVNAANAWVGAGGTREIEVAQIRLDTALPDAGIAPGFDLLVVDVDGMEEAVFQSFDLAHWRPRCMIVELIESSPGFVGHDRLIEASARVRGLIADRGYETIYRDQSNTVLRLVQT
jgi:FkbM family methyltransferase